MVGPLKRLEHRVTMPRGAGQKQAHYEIPLWIHASRKDEAVAGDDFDIALEAIQAAFRKANVPTVITDPLTGEQTTLLSIGEEMHLQQEQPTHVSGGPGGLVHLYAELIATATEVLFA